MAPTTKELRNLAAQRLEEQLQNREGLQLDVNYSEAVKRIPLFERLTLTYLELHNSMLKEEEHGS